MARVQKQPKGFTIIEVMIVLAIAGLIMLIVFLAVPTLQRTSRNTQRKDDAAAALQAVNEYLTNNGGTLPGANYNLTGQTFTVGATGTAQSTAKLGYYTSAVTIVAAYAAPAATPTDSLTIYQGTKCTNATTSAAGTSRQIAAVYAVETPGSASGYTWQCQES